MEVTVLEVIYSELCERSNTLGCLDVFINNIISYFQSVWEHVKMLFFYSVIFRKEIGSFLIFASYNLSSQKKNRERN